MKEAEVQICSPTFPLCNASMEISIHSFAYSQSQLANKLGVVFSAADGPSYLDHYIVTLILFFFLLIHG